MTSSVESSVYDDTLSRHDVESGYSSGSSDASADEGMPIVSFTKSHLRFLNKQLAQMEPQDILRWCLTSLPNLYQSTAFGLSGLVILDMISKITDESPDLIFFDTLHHFSETLDLVERVRSRYPNTALHVYKPENADTAEDFTALHGERLWETNEELYDFVAKVEPSQRAFRNLRVRALLTGRRRSQGGKRGDMEIVEVVEGGLIKINPLANWDFERVRKYIDENDVPYNELLDRGYKSVGDWHSTQPIQEGEDERAGRWKGQEKTECGIHNKRSRYAQFLMEMELKRQQEEADKVDSGAETEENLLASRIEGLTVA